MMKTAPKAALPLPLEAAVVEIVGLVPPAEEMPEDLAQAAETAGPALSVLLA